MAPKLYGSLNSPPSRAVLMCVKELGVDMEHIEVDMTKGEQRKPEFLKKNPQHTIPLLDDDGFCIWDSHAIMAYLVRKYKKGSSLYPEDLKTRAIVDQRLHFDSATLFARHVRICSLIFAGGIKTVPEALLEALTEAYGFLEVFLEGRKYFAGDELTIADFSIWTTVTNSSIYSPVEKYPNITSWIQRMKETPYNEMNEIGALFLKNAFNQ